MGKISKPKIVKPIKLNIDTAFVKSGEKTPKIKTKQIVNSFRNWMGKPFPITIKGLGYSQKAKQLLRECPNLMKNILNLQKQNQICKRRFIGVNKLGNKYSYSIEKHVAVNFVHFGSNTNNYYILKTNTVHGSKNFFIKETSTEAIYYLNMNAFHELKALQIIKDAGFNIIPAHFAYTDVHSGKSFIAYDFSNYIILDEAYNKQLILSPTVYEICNKLDAIQQKVNKYLEKHRTKYELHDGIKKIEDILPYDKFNVFVDPKTKKIYLFDPWLRNHEDNISDHFSP